MERYRLTAQSPMCDDEDFLDDCEEYKQLPKTGLVYMGPGFSSPISNNFEELQNYAGMYSSHHELSSTMGNPPTIKFNLWTVWKERDNMNDWGFALLKKDFAPGIVCEKSGVKVQGQQSLRNGFENPYHSRKRRSHLMQGL